jgi:hypothetical protein
MSARSAVRKSPETRPKHYEYTVFSLPTRGCNMSPKEFFNTLRFSQKFVLTGFSEAG